MGLIGDAMSFGSQQRAQVNAKRNYKHRYRWAMDDMKKAGLNPILTAAQGIGGSFQSGSGQSMSGPDLQKTASNVMQYKRQKTELDNIRSQTTLAGQSALNQRESARLALMNTNNTESVWELNKARTLNEQLLTPDLINNATLARDWGKNKATAEWLSKNVGNVLPSFLLNFRKPGVRGTAGAAANRTPGRLSERQRNSGNLGSSRVPSSGVKPRRKTTHRSHKFED